MPAGRIFTKEHAQAFADSVSLGPSIYRLFGRLEGVRVLELARRVSHDHDEGPVGWELEWSFAKRCSSTGHSLFTFTISVYVPHRQKAGRATESVFVAFRRFLEHELGEGLMVGDAKPFDPHRLDAASAQWWAAEQREEPESS